MIFGRKKRRESGAEETAVDSAEGALETTETDEAEGTSTETGETGQAGEVGLDEAALDAAEWRDDGPYDIVEIDLQASGFDGRIDLGSMIISGPAGAELRLQVAEGTQQIISAMVITPKSALELAAFAAPRSGGLWPELREEYVEQMHTAGGSAAVVEGPFGVELRRMLPMQTPDGQPGYQPTRMWVAEGPRWLLRGIVYGQAAITEGQEAPVAELLDCFRSTVIRRGDEARAPGDLLPLSMPQAVPAGSDADGTDAPETVPVEPDRTATS